MYKKTFASILFDILHIVFIIRIHNFITMKGLHTVTFVLLIIGGLNWLLSVFGWDVATWGLPTILVQTVYVLVGLSAVIELFSHKSNCKCCDSNSMGMSGQM